MTRAQAHHLDDVAVALARHGWHVTCELAGDGSAALLVRARWAGQRCYRVAADETQLFLTRSGPATDSGPGGDPVGTAFSTEQLHGMLRADAVGARAAA